MQVPNLKTRIVGNYQDFMKFKNKFLASEDFLAFKSMIYEILTLGTLCLLTFLAFTNSNLIIKLIGLGSGLWLVQEKIVPILTQLFGSISLVKSYK